MVLCPPNVRVLSACLVVASALAGGCGGRPPAADDSSRADALSITSTRFAPTDGPGGRTNDAADRAVVASALAFSPPVTFGEPALDLDRAARRPAAFFGYEEGFVETYRLTVDDRQLGLGGSGFGGSHGGGGGRSAGGWGSGGGWYDRYDRQAVSERTGVIRR
ncbi:MAG: hypothetical protein JWO31_1658 [Phycisphaerales bacterium]|nr:hypothetical protein [Phycisphaerales bacterium]